MITGTMMAVWCASVLTALLTGVLIGRDWRQSVDRDKPTLEFLFWYVGAMLDDGCSHNTKGFRLSSMTWDDMNRHLLEEITELRESMSKEHAREELADVLGVAVHLAIELGMTEGVLVAHCVRKLRKRFDEPFGAMPEWSKP